MKEKVYLRHKQELLDWGQMGIAGFLVRNMGEYKVLRELGKEIIIDYNMNVTNNEALALWEEQGVTRTTLSVELMPNEIARLKGRIEKIVYGHIPVMTSSQCVLRGTSACQKGVQDKHYFELEDRKQISWRVETDCQVCMMQIMSYEPLALKANEWLSNGVLRIQLTNESKVQTEEILRGYFKERQLSKIKGITFKPVL